MKSLSEQKNALKSRLYDASKIDFDHLTFSGQQLRALMIPLIIQTLLESLMGMVDSMMVSNLGSAALSAVSLADSINVLVIQVFSAFAAGATIICSHYIGAKDLKAANEAAEQVMISVAFLAGMTGLVCFLANRPLLGLVFGAVEPDVMENAVTYFSYTSVSFPFIALFSAGSAFYRAGGESRFPTIVGVCSNCLNIAGNALFMYGFGMGIAGAALSTLLSRMFSCVWIFLALRRQTKPIVIRRYAVRPDFRIIKKIFNIGIPSAVENGMFQFGKLAIQSSVSTLGTTQIAAQAMTVIFETLNGMAPVAIGTGLMTIVGQCLGSGRVEEAKYFTARICRDAWVALLLNCLIVYALAGPVCILAGMEPAAREQCLYMTLLITIVKPLIWVPSFTPANAMRAAGDVRYTMIAASCTMWICRVLVTTLLIRAAGVGAVAVWIGMFMDWGCRGIIFTRRYFSGRWLKHHVI